MKDKTIDILNVAAQAIYDKKGFNILALNVKGLSTLTDYFIIAEGNIDRHLHAISLYLQDHLKQHDQKAWHVEGVSGDWVVLDYGDFIIHLLTSEMREKYSLEQLWNQAKIVDVEINVNQTVSNEYQYE